MKLYRVNDFIIQGYNVPKNIIIGTLRVAPYDYDNLLYLKYDGKQAYKFNYKNYNVPIITDDTYFIPCIKKEGMQKGALIHLKGFTLFVYVK